MVKYNPTELDNIFNALSHEVRRDILQKLIEKPCTVMELAKPFHISGPAITKHLHVLERSQLILRKKEGRMYILKINAKPLLEVKEWLIFYERFWIQQLKSSRN